MSNVPTLENAYMETEEADDALPDEVARMSVDELDSRSVFISKLN